MKFWLITAGFTLAFVLAGIFFATRHSLGEADQYASVGSFLLALATLGGTAIVAARKRELGRPAEPSAAGDLSSAASASGGGANGATGSRIRIGKIKNVRQMTVGDQTTTYVYNDDLGHVTGKTTDSSRTE